MQITKRFVVDVGRKCNINCRFCYYHHLGDLRKQTFRPLQDMKNCIDAGISRGNNYYDFTGGETSIYPDICELIKYGLEKNVKSCLITNGLAGESTYQKIIDAGINDFLISIHGTELTHDYLIDLQGGFKRQEKILQLINKNKINLRFNCVINRFNQNELKKMVEYMSQFKPYIVNFINMNLHHDWKSDTITAKDLIADLRIVEPILNDSIEYLNSKGIITNVRYYPYCRLNKNYWQNICNYNLVLYDPWEWDYCIPKTESAVKQWINTEKNNIGETMPCKDCDLFNICGGANKYHHQTSKIAGYGEIYNQIKIGLSQQEKDNIFLYRQNSKIYEYKLF